MSNLDTILSYLRSNLGLSGDQAAAVAGNWQIESGLNPSAYNAKEGAIGLAQWEGGRRTALQKFAAARGTTESDLNTQLAFFKSEMLGSESSAYSALKSTTSVTQAATVFDQKYERSAGTSRSQRIAAALQIANGGSPGLSTPAAGGGSIDAATVNAALPGWMTGLLPYLPGGNLVAGATAGVANAGEEVAGFLGQIGTWIVDGLLILLGAALVIVALVLIAKGGESAERSPTIVLPAAGGSTAGKGRGAAGEATEAAEVAAA